MDFAIDYEFFSQKVVEALGYHFLCECGTSFTLHCDDFFLLCFYEQKPDSGLRSEFVQRHHPEQTLCLVSGDQKLIIPLRLTHEAFATKG